MMRWRLVWAALATCLLSTPALAQTASQIQALEVGAASQYGVPVQILQGLIYAESSNNPNIGCNSYGACGLAQFIPATAAQYGVNVNDAQSSIYGAAHYLSDLQAQYGSYTIALTKYSGGCTASNPCNPAYASLFQVAQEADNGTLTAADSEPLTVDNVPMLDANGNPVVDGNGNPITMPTLSTAGSSVSVTTTSTFAPFTQIWNAYQSGVQQTLTSAIGTIQQNVNGTVGNLLVLDVAILGIVVVYGMSSTANFWSKLFRAGLVVSLLGAQNLYSNWIMAFFGAFPNWIGQGLGLPNTGVGAFDQILLIYLEKSNLALSAQYWFTGSWWWTLFLVGAGGLITGIVDAVMFAVWFLSQALTHTLFLIGPLLCLALLWDYTRHLFDYWLSTLIHLALTAFYAVVLANLTLNLISKLLIQIPPGGTVQAAALFGAAVGIFALGSAVSVLPWVLSHITRGAVGAASIWRHAGATAVANAPTAAIGAAVGAAPAGISRMTAPAASSLSRG